MPPIAHRSAAYFALAAATLLAGCAGFAPKALPEPEQLLAPGIAEAAALPAVAHPRLPPAPIDLHAPLSELDLARLALVASPDLAAMRRQVGVAEAQVFAAGLLPDPQLTLSLDHPDDASLVNGLTGALGFDLAALFSRGAALSKGRHELERVHNDVAWNEWLQINQVRTLVRRIAYLEAQARVAADAAAATRRVYELNRRALQQGDAKLDDTSLYQVGYLDARDRQLALERAIATTRVELNALVGLAPDTPLLLAPPPAPRPIAAVAALGLPGRYLRERFDLLALREGYAAQESELRRATRASLPLPSLEINRARDTSAVWTRGLALAFSLPLWNRGRGDIRVAQATREQLAAEYAARVLQARSDIARAATDLAALDRQRAALDEELPALAHAAEVMEKAARAGDVALVSYETVRASLLDKRLALLALEQAQSEGEVALESAAGDRLWPAATPR
jgi:outer membrane protein TolC